MSEKSDEVKILELSIKVLTQRLNDLLTDSTDEKGQPKAPSRKVYMQSRACLPANYSMALTKKPGKEH